MGVRGLLSYCSPIKRHANMNVENLRIYVDAFSLLFLFREERKAFEKYLRLLKTKSSKHGLIFIMDKRAAKEKREVVKERKDNRKEAKAEATSLSSFTQSPEFDELDINQQRVLEKAIAQKERAAWCLYPEYVEWFQKLLESLDITLLWAPEEADTILASSMHNVIISSDSDLLILGSKKLWIPQLKRDLEVQHTEIDGEEFLKFLGIQGEQLFELAYMAGCDVQPRSIMPVKEAVSRLRFYGSLQVFHEKHPEIITSENICEYKRLRRDVWTY